MYSRDSVKNLTKLNLYHSGWSSLCKVNPILGVIVRHS